MIRLMNSSEINEVMNIWLKTTVTAHSFIPKQYWLDSYETVEKQYIPMAETFIFYEESKVKGFISIIDKSFIGALFVLNEYHGQGIGKKLINHCKTIYTQLELAVYKDNKYAVEFYKLCGFKILKEQINEDSGFLEYIMKFEI